MSQAGCLLYGTGWKCYVAYLETALIRFIARSRVNPPVHFHALIHLSLSFAPAAPVDRNIRLHRPRSILTPESFHPISPWREKSRVAVSPSDEPAGPPASVTAKRLRFS